MQKQKQKKFKISVIGLTLVFLCTVQKYTSTYTKLFLTFLTNNFCIPRKSVLFVNSLESVQIGGGRFRFIPRTHAY